MPRARSRRSSSAACVSPWSWPTSSRAFCASRSIRPSASLSLTASATSCCCAPSWMLRSSRRRSASCAETSRFCAAFRSSSRALSASVRRTLLSTSPAWDGEIGDQLLVRRRDGIARRLADRERAQQLARLHDRVHAIDALDRGDRPVRQRDRRRPVDVVGPGRDVSQLPVDGQPHVGALGADALAQDPRHPRQHVLVGVGPADAFGELRQHLVRRRALAVDDAVGEPREPRARRLERERHDHGRHHGQERVVASQPDAHADHEPRGRSAWRTARTRRRSTSCGRRRPGRRGGTAGRRSRPRAGTSGTPRHRSRRSAASPGSRSWWRARPRARPPIRTPPT